MVLAAVKHRLAMVHVNDIRQAGQFEPVLVGSGVAPLEAIFQTLHAAGFDGWISLEEASRTGEAGFRQAVPYVDALWAKVSGSLRKNSL
jgi:sugar phosphate isomerase/epimerase